MNGSIIVVAGPTSSGKSDFAVDLALKIDGEIISADSRQVYRKLDIGSGKITKEEMRGVPHHMLDVFDVGDEISVTTYKEKALPILEDILSRGKTPIICGGTGQYIDALIYDQPLPLVPPNETLRTELETKTTEELVQKLKDLDEDRLGVIGTHNRVRLVRSIEIAEALGKVPELPDLKLRYPTTMYILTPARELMHERITARLDKRFDQGMTQEVKNLLADGVLYKDLERLGLEYRYITRHVRGELSEKEMVEQLTFKTNQYGKRQVTWLKKYPKDPRIELHIIDVR